MASIYLNIGMSFDPMGEAYVILPEEEIVPQTHEYLFHYLAADLSRLEAYAQNYLSCLDTGAEPDKVIMQRIREELSLLHPFYRACQANATVLINKAFASYIKSKYPDSAEDQKKAMTRVLETKYLYQPDISYWIENASCNTFDTIFSELQLMQERIRQWVFVVLDNSNPDLARLTNAQRNGIYGLVYGNAYTPLLEMTVQKSTQFPYNYRLLGIQMDFDEKYEQAVMQGLQQMQKMPNTTPECVKELIDDAANMIGDCEIHIYITQTLEDLLKYEVYGMTMAEKRIKRCKNCGQYFVVGKSNVEYCDRIAGGETKPCNEIGKSRTYEQKIAKGGTAMALYRKAYKTHFARIRSGNMTREQFEEWKTEATAKRIDVENGKLDLDEYASWLKK